VTRPTRDGESGFVGGIEVLPFGLLVFVGATLLIVNAWGVVDARLAVATASREAGRAYVESGLERGPAAAEGEARQAADRSVSALGRDPSRLHLDVSTAGFTRCAAVVHRASYQVPTLTIPFVGSWGHAITVSATHRDVVDPFASGINGDGDCVP
jgi:hypothetical protein